MEDQSQVPALPSLSEWLSNWLGFQIPTLPLPQTLKNLDKAFGRIVLAGGENIVSRFDASTGRRQARSRAEVEIIDSAAHYASEKLPANPTLADRATTYAFAESLLKQQNREKIFEHAAHELANEAPAIDREIGKDWLNEFSEIASKKSSEDIQILWGKILAGEIRSPGSFSLQFLNRLSYIDTTQANRIYDFMQFVVDYDLVYQVGPVVNLQFGKILELEDLGVLIGTASSLRNKMTILGNGAVQNMFLAGVVLGLAAPTDVNVDLPAYPLTSFGKQLSNITTSPRAPEDYVTALITHLKNSGITVKRAELLGPSAIPGKLRATPWRDA